MLWGKKARKQDGKLPGHLGRGVACNVYGVQSPKVPFKQRPKELEPCSYVGETQRP